jgi:hypothetical protein
VVYFCLCQLGIFGAITPLQYVPLPSPSPPPLYSPLTLSPLSLCRRSFPKSRKALFDVALAGPLVGLALSIGLFILGLVLTPASFADPSDAAILRYSRHTAKASFC